MAVSAQQIISGLERRGIPRNVAIGFAGNAAVESGYDPAINEISPMVKGSRGGFGLFQWTGPRRKQLEAFARSKGLDVADPETQLDFLAWELANTEKSAAQKIMSTNDPIEATRIVSDAFLRPGIPHMDRRIAAAQEILGGGGTDTMSGGEGQDTIAAMLADLLGGGDDKNAEQPTPADAYASTGALDVDQMLAEMVPDVWGDVIPVQPYTPGEPTDTPEKPFFDITESVTREPRELLSATGKSIMGQGPSVAAGMLPEALPEGMRQGAGRVLDVPLGVVGAMGLGYNAAVGAGADVAEALGVPRAKALARDVVAMPEAFAGSPQQFAAPAMKGVSQTARRQPVPPAMPAKAPAVAAPKPVAALTGDEIGALSRKAASNFLGSKKAAQKLAAAARVNPEAKAAAERLNIDLPADVFADDQMVREAVGLTRSLAGSEASAEWRNTVIKAIDRADDVMREIDGSPDLSSISDKTFRSLQGTIKGLDDQASALYDAVDNAVPRKTIIQPNNTVKALNSAIEDLGGVDGFSAAETKLYKMLTNPDQPVSYERLMREKRQIGRAIAKGDGPYADADQAILKRLYGALADDQLANVEAVGGADLRANLELANGITSKKKALEATVVDAFGKDLEGSIAGKLRTAITQGAKGDIGGLNRVLGVIPENLRGEAITSAIASLTQSARAIEGGFGFAEYTKLYRGLRANSQVYSTLAKEVGPERARVMRDLYEVSRRITDARANVLTTGKANQAIVQSMLAEGVVEKVLNKTAGRALSLATGGVRGAIGDALTATVSGGGGISKNRAAAASNLFRSPEFQKMLTDAASTGQITSSQAKRLSGSKAFKSWAKSNNIENPHLWLLAAIGSSKANEAGNGE